MPLIIRVTEASGEARVKVDGWLDGAGVAELARILEAEPRPLRLLLHDLRGADALGLSLLKGQAEAGTPLEGLSTYLKLVMGDGASVTPRPSGPVAGSETPVRSKHT
jgi:hypothetical protein